MKLMKTCGSAVRLLTMTVCLSAVTGVAMPAVAAEPALGTTHPGAAMHDDAKNTKSAANARAKKIRAKAHRNAARAKAHARALRDADNKTVAN